jgi:Na+-driven multidrug efflux pump
MVLSIGYAFGGMYFAVTNYVFHAGATARLGGITASAGIINVATAYLLIRHFGVIGAGYGVVVSQLLLFHGTWRLAQKVSPMPWLKVFRS